MITLRGHKTIMYNSSCVKYTVLTPIKIFQISKATEVFELLKLVLGTLLSSRAASNIIRKKTEFKWNEF